MRHGEAESYGYGVNDSQRQLTGFGRREVCSTAEQFMLKADSIDVIVASPYVRAQQTAEVFIKRLGVELHCLTSDLITPSGQEHKVMDYLQGLPYSNILLVTHQPFASEFVEYLCDHPLPSQFAMTTATLASIDLSVVAMACGQLDSVIRPSVEY